MNAASPSTYSDDELREQWSFLDALVDRQASTLRQGVQDQEEEVVLEAHAAASSALVTELAALRERVRILEEERRELLERLQIAELRNLAAQRAAQQRVGIVPHWWRRVRR